MKIALSLICRHRCKVAAGIHQVLRHKYNQNSPHTIIAKAFREFIADNKRNAGGYFSGRSRGGTVGRFHKIKSLIAFNFIWICAFLISVGLVDNDENRAGCIILPAAWSNRKPPPPATNWTSSRTGFQTTSPVA